MLPAIDNLDIIDNKKKTPDLKCHLDFLYVTYKSILIKYEHEITYFHYQYTNQKYQKCLRFTELYFMYFYDI